MNIIQAQNKSRILRETADRVEGDDFNWSDVTCCVVGNMVKVALDLSDDDIEESISSSKTWTAQAFESICDNTGLSLNTIVRELQLAGFSLNEIERAEFGTHEARQVFDDKRAMRAVETEELERAESIAQRLRAWADEIDRAVLREQSGVKTVERVAQSVIGRG